MIPPYTSFSPEFNKRLGEISNIAITHRFYILDHSIVQYDLCSFFRRLVLKVKKWAVYSRFCPRQVFSENAVVQQFSIWGGPVNFVTLFFSISFIREKPISVLTKRTKSVKRSKRGLNSALFFFEGILTVLPY